MKLSELPTPCYIVDRGKLEENLRLLKQIEDQTGAKILLAQKAFSTWYFYPLIREYLSGAAASGLYEAKLSAEKLGKQTHVFSPAYREEEWRELLLYADHLIFNSATQFKTFAPRAKAAGKQVGLRINPEHSTQKDPIYDPCAEGSRLGVTRKIFERNFTTTEIGQLDGIHFHTLCEQGAEPLAETLEVVENEWKDVLKRVKWINLGGGHHITKPGYNVELLIECILNLRETYGITVFLEPGEAIALQAGTLVATVMDITENGRKIAILDASAACHMPDVLEMPYRPEVRNGGLPGEKGVDYILGGPTCLASDVIGEYSFDHELTVGERLELEDMAIYSMVKNNTFNGMRLPSIAEMDLEGDYSLIKSFDYGDFVGRLS